MLLSTYPGWVGWYLLAVAGLLGCVLGSALNCLCLRLAAGEKWGGNERSRCPKCGHPLGVPDLVPVLSWLCLGGKCRYCKSPISPRYVAAELGLGALYMSVVLKYGLTFDAGCLLVLVTCLLGLSLVDLDIQIIPDRFLLIPAVCRAALLLLYGGPMGLLKGIVPGLVLGGGVLALSLVMDKLLKKDTMGGGDIKLLAVLGMFFSLSECLLLVLLACILGIAMASILLRIDSETAFPFGPALSAAAWVTMMVGSEITGWYLSLF